MYPIERLGNQLFTYAAVFAQARRLSVPCYVNKAFFDKVRPERSYHYKYELDVFDSGLVVPTEDAYHLPVFLGFPTIPAARWWHNQSRHSCLGKAALYSWNAPSPMTRATRRSTRDDCAWHLPVVALFR